MRETRIPESENSNKGEEFGGRLEIWFRKNKNKGKSENKRKWGERN